MGDVFGIEGGGEAEQHDRQEQGERAHGRPVGDELAQRPRPGTQGRPLQWRPTPVPSQS